MIQYEAIFSQYLGKGYPSGGASEWRYTCPFCRDKEKSFAVNYARGKYICFRGHCNAKGTLDYLAQKLGFKFQEAPLLSSLDQLRHRLYALDHESTTPVVDEPVHIPELRQIHPGCYAWTYLTGTRGLTSRDIYDNELSLSREDYDRFIYFPQRNEEGDLVFWVKRKYLPGTHGPKYRNPGSSIKKRLLYRSHLIDLNYPVSIVEGPLSAIVAGNACATLGVKFSQEQVEAVARLKCPIFSAMDGEEFQKSVELATRVQNQGREDVWVVPLPRGEDPASVGRTNYYGFCSRAFSVEPGSVVAARHRLERVF